MKMRFVVPVFAALAFSSIAGAQTASKAADAPAKIGVIDFQGAIASTAEGKKDAAQLQTEFAPRQQELANLQKQGQDLQTKLSTGANTLSDDEKARLQSQINQVQTSGQRKLQDLQDDMNAREQDFVQEIGSKMVQVVDKYAKENGFTIVIDGGSQQSTVVWAAPDVNITQPIISLYDSTYPAKTSSTTAPSSSTPHTTPPAHPSGPGNTKKP